MSKKSHPVDVRAKVAQGQQRLQLLRGKSQFSPFLLQLLPAARFPEGHLRHVDKREARKKTKQKKFSTISMSTRSTPFYPFEMWLALRETAEGVKHLSEFFFSRNDSIHGKGSWKAEASRLVHSCNFNRLHPQTPGPSNGISRIYAACSHKKQWSRQYTHDTKDTQMRRKKCPLDWEMREARAPSKHGVNNNGCRRMCWAVLWLRSWAPVCAELWAALPSAQPRSSGGCQSRRKASSEMGPPLWTAPWSNCRGSMEHIQRSMQAPPMWIHVQSVG